MKLKYLIFLLLSLLVFTSAISAQRKTTAWEYVTAKPTTCNPSAQTGVLIFVQNDGPYYCKTTNHWEPIGGAVASVGANNRSKDIQIYTSLAAAVTGVNPGGAAAGSLLTVSTPTNCSSVLNFANSTSLEFTGTGKIVAQSGCNLTITGKILAANTRIFSGFTKDNLHLAADVDRYYPEWFGAVGDGSTDDFAAIQLLFDAVRYPNLAAGATNSYIGGKVVFGRKNYRISKEIRIARPFEIDGAGGNYREKPLTVIAKPVSSRGFVFQDFSAGEQFGAFTVAGSANVTALNSRFSASDIGKVVRIYGAGAPNGSTATNLQATISSVTDETHITLSQPAGATTNDNGIFTAYVGTNVSTAKGSILRGIGIVSDGGEADNLTITTVAAVPLATDGTKFGRMVISASSGTGRQLYTSDTTNQIGKSSRTVPEGTIVGIGATRWMLRYTTLTGIDEVPYLTTRYRVDAAAGSNQITTGTQSFESWMVGARLKIRGNYYLIGSVPASNTANLTYAPQGAFQPAPLGTAGASAVLPALNGETIEVVSLPTNSTSRTAHIFLNHAVVAEVSMTIENCYIGGTYGDGIHFDSFITQGGVETNLNYSRITHNAIYESQGNGIRTRGKNTNVVAVKENTVENSKGVGFYEGSILGNGYYDDHASGNILGDYYSDPQNGVNQSSFFNCYSEGSAAGDAVLGPAIQWYGGVPGNGFSETENKAPVLLGSPVSTNHLLALDGAMRATNKRPFSSDGNGIGYYDQLTPVITQIGASDRRPTLFGFGSADDGANRPGEFDANLKVNYSWVYNNKGYFPGWYSFGYQLFGDVNQPSQVLMAVSGTNTVLGTNAALNYAGSYRLWFPNGMYFGQKSVTANGKTATDPAFKLTTDTLGLTLDANFKVNTFQVDSLGTRPTCNLANRSTVWVNRGITGAGSTADVPQMCLKNADDTFTWHNITIN